MNVYVLRIHPGENDSDGLNFDEWFCTLREAKARRKELLPDCDWKYGEDLEIERFAVTSKLSKHALVVACLNRKFFAAYGPVLAVPAAQRPPREEPIDE